MSFPAPVIAAIVLWFAAASPAIATEPPSAPPLLDTIVLWLTTNFNLPASAEAPVLVGAPPAELVAMRYGTETAVAPGDVVAVYDAGKRAIYLTDRWTGHSPAELSVLVHELVHHLQSVADMRFACPGEREALAYQAQDAWLALFGESLDSAFDIDPATLLVATACIH